MSGVQSVARAMAVLQRLSESGEAGVNELARDLGLAPSTVQRLLGALVEVGLVEQNPADRSYHVGLRLFQWGQAPLRRSGLRELAKPFLQELAAEVGETIALGVLDGTHVMHVEWIPARHLVQPRVGIGDRIPAYSSSLGRCLLAWLPERQRTETLWEAAKSGAPRSDTAAQEEVLARVRERGYAVVDDTPPNICTVAAPIWGSGRRVVGALGIGGPTTRFPVERASSLAPLLMEVGAAIGGRYGTTLSVLNERDGA